MVPEPERVVRAHDGPSYDIKFYGEDEDALLLSCGDDGSVRGWKWKEFAESDVSLRLQEDHAQPLCLNLLIHNTKKELTHIKVRVMYKELFKESGFVGEPISSV